MRIALIGSGNVGHHLGKRLVEQGQAVTQVFSRDAAKAKQLGELLSSDWTNQLSAIIPEADLYILAVSDRAIGSVADALSKIISPQSFVVHTSGATPSTVFQPYFRRFGVFYPLQTFSVEKEVDFERLPLCIFASREEDILMLEKIGRQICPNIYKVDDNQRAYLHVGAVMVNNFTNHLFTLAEQLLAEHHLPFDLLKPLILETALKVQTYPPEKMQTGPAIRGDQNTISQHLELLKDHPDYQAIYQLITNHILPKP